jgi:hypothetical protein
MDEAIDLDQMLVYMEKLDKWSRLAWALCKAVP